MFCHANKHQSAEAPPQVCRHAVCVGWHSLAYHPYCAYSKGYSCPIVPKENDLPVKIEAGVKLK
ncbi:MAG: DUF1684 domain-containing protein [Flammeovirgaceae bacterium]